MAILSLLILTFSNGCISLTFGSVYTKPGDFLKLGLHFYDFVDQYLPIPLFTNSYLVFMV